jgi:hypothetical protein
MFSEETGNERLELTSGVAPLQLNFTNNICSGKSGRVGGCDSRKVT